MRGRGRGCRGPVREEKGTTSPTTTRGERKVGFPLSAALVARSMRGEELGRLQLWIHISRLCGTLVAV
jgi:hypothetical protein